MTTVFSIRKGLGTKECSTTLGLQRKTYSIIECVYSTCFHSLLETGFTDRVHDGPLSCCSTFSEVVTCHGQEMPCVLMVRLSVRELSTWYEVAGVPAYRVFSCLFCSWYLQPDGSYTSLSCRAEVTLRICLEFESMCIKSWLQCVVYIVSWHQCGYIIVFKYIMWVGNAINEWYYLCLYVQICK